MKLGSCYRVQVSRIMLTPLNESAFLLMTGGVSVPDGIAHSCTSPPRVTADAEFTGSTSLPLARNFLSDLRAIAVTHY